VEAQVQELTGLNQQAKDSIATRTSLKMRIFRWLATRPPFVFYRYAVIDGRAMTEEAIRPRVRGEVTFVDSLIDFAVAAANQCLVPLGITKGHWDRLSGMERFYLKMSIWKPAAPNLG
jgi:putative DNA methylase